MYSELAGVPVALIGLIGYIAILGSLLAPESERTRFATMALTLGGFGFSAYLTYRELFTIHKICEWCVSSAVIMTIMMCLSVWRFLRGDAGSVARRRRPGRRPRASRRSRCAPRSRVAQHRRLSAPSRSASERGDSPAAGGVPRAGRSRRCGRSCGQSVQQRASGPSKRAARPTWLRRHGIPATQHDLHTGAASTCRATTARRGIARLFEMTSDLLATISLDGRFTLLNPAWEQLLGWTPRGAAGAADPGVHPPRGRRADARADARRRPAAGQLENFTNRYRHRDGSWRWLLWSARRDGDTWYAAAKDVTDRMWLERQALHDPLTRLPNRLLLMDRARQALDAPAPQRDGVVAMLFIDLDKFKAVNDNLGHDVGDRLLVAVSERLAELMRDSDTVARLGGDEFVILAEDIDSEGEALALAERVLDALERPFPLGTRRRRDARERRHRRSRTTPNADPEAMLREADLAMYRAKSAGGRRLELFDESLRRGGQRAPRDRGPAARRAARAQELLLAYQPILPLAGGHAIGCEALVRWRPRGEHRRRARSCCPSTFLPPAEESDLIVQIGNWVLHTACAQAEIWRRNGHRDPGLGQRLRARADRARPRRARARGARLLPPARPRAVHRGQRGGRAARPRARARRR